jgi:hypothetical protein
MMNCRTLLGAMLAGLVLLPPGAANADDTVKSDTHYSKGDRYSYRTVDLFSKVNRGEQTLTVTNVRDDKVVFNNGEIEADLLGNDIKVYDQSFSDVAMFLPEYVVGQKGSTRYHYVVDGREYLVTADFQVVARETITVPAGTFDTVRIEGKGYRSQGRGLHMRGTDYVFEYKFWIAPDKVRRFVAQEYAERCTVLRCLLWTERARTELVSFQQAN